MPPGVRAGPIGPGVSREGIYGLWNGAGQGRAATAAAARGGDKDHLTSFGGLSLDALSPVAYGPEAIVLVLVAAGTSALRLTLPVTLAIAVLLAVLVVSYWARVLVARLFNCRKFPVESTRMVTVGGLRRRTGSRCLRPGRPAWRW
jgi:hypothetical protein